ncbi:XRE family transcriptional regulator [Rhizobiaceae bacterium n13]|uniref:XRE family transcriptional regulator n=1 Tax=Ferirhizobium litorale TaxID=2927786 RepID=A0AAE3QJF7_9HYPH|nr:XRE family transcriptional regulator [Fererhizobium litorale]MDI7863940.1 XRE family transcriptional regulator [Fererhizobium litorale]MDI7924228.1 XRE family transcriptional regulator [Fererhizobium litorale]
MLSETLANELERYRIGPRIRALRLKKKMGLVQLGAHTGLSSAMLSKIERGQLFPTLPTLLRVALVFGVDLNHFFAREGPRLAVTRKGDRLRLPIPPGGEGAPCYSFESLDYPFAERRMDAYLADFTTTEKRSQPHRHGSEEFVYVLKGRLNVNVDGEEISLGEGDAMHFDSSVPHSYCRDDGGDCEAIVVTAP